LVDIFGLKSRFSLSGLLEGQVHIAIQALADIAQNGTSEAARVSAACAILDRTHDLRRFVLDRAVAEINHLAGFRMGYVPIKRGRKITAVKLTWGRKDLPS
jgi:hypothetical protein